MFESDGMKSPNSKLKRTAIVKGSSKDKSAKLKLSSWYEEAARSIRISNKTSARNSDEASE
jgi:hypothetical protein